MESNNKELLCRKCEFTKRYCECTEPEFEEYPGQLQEEKKLQERRKYEETSDQDEFHSHLGSFEPTIHEDETDLQ
jgi:hypothetical protein